MSSKPASSSSEPHESAREYTRIGFIGDIHTEVDRLQWALEVLRSQEVERVCATGDIVDGPYTGEAITHACSLLKDANAVTVLGNHDRWFLDGERREREDATLFEELDDPTRDFLQALPSSAELNTPRGKLLLGHGLGSNDMASLYPYDHGQAVRLNTSLQEILAQRQHRFVVSGHTHVRMVRNIEGVTFVNAGALHAEREPCCCLVLDIAQMRAQFFDLGDGFTTKSGPSFEL